MEPFKFNSCLPGSILSIFLLITELCTHLTTNALQFLAGHVVFHYGTSTWLPQLHFPASLADACGDIKFRPMGCEKKYVCDLGVSALEACLEFPTSCWLDTAMSEEAVLGPEAEAKC